MSLVTILEAKVIEIEKKMKTIEQCAIDLIEQIESANEDLKSYREAIKELRELKKDK